MDNNNANLDMDISASPGKQTIGTIKRCVIHFLTLNLYSTLLDNNPDGPPGEKIFGRQIKDVPKQQQRRW